MRLLNRLNKHAKAVSTFLLFTGLLVAPMLASAQNLLLNGNFETPVQSGFGNHIGANVAPWLIGGGQPANVVKVDPSVGNFGAGGPNTDHTNPGSLGQYLDVTNGTNSFYQVFTVPPCDSAPLKNYQLFGWFSTRDNQAAVATIRLLNGSGLGGSAIAGASATINMPAGTSATDPWVSATASGFLTAGQTFTFVVDLNDFANADDLSLVLLDPFCPADLSLVKAATTSYVSGASGTYSFTVTNAGSFATSVATTGTTTVKDVLPAGLSFGTPLTPGGANAAAWTCVRSTTANANDTATCTTTTAIAAGGSSVFTLPVSVASNLGGATLNNRAKVFGGGDPNKATETTTGAITACASDGLAGAVANAGCGFEATLVTAAASLVIAKTDSKTLATSGATNSYVVTLTNQGPSEANGVILTDVVGVGLTCPASNAVTCLVTAGSAACPAGSLTFADLLTGITIATFPNASSLQLTYTCNVN